VGQVPSVNYFTSFEQSEFISLPADTCLNRWTLVLAVACFSTFWQFDHQKYTSRSVASLELCLDTSWSEVRVNMDCFLAWDHA